MKFTFLNVVLVVLLWCTCEVYCGNETEPKNSSDAKSDNAYQDSKRQRESIVRDTIRAGSTESCDLLKNPMSVLRGEACGSHYKVLGLNRKSPIDNKTVRKAYHKLSLSTHPDKTGGKDSEIAFNLVQTAYDCLSDPDCQREYNYKLDTLEEEIHLRRLQIRERVTEEVKAVANAIREGAVTVASFVVKVADDISERLEWKVNVYDRTVDAGAWIASSLLLIFCRPVAYSLILSRGILFLNSMLEDRWPQFRRQRHYGQRHYFD